MMVGSARRKDVSTMIFFGIFMSEPPRSVEPDRETPGIRLATCIHPSKRNSVSVGSRSL